jgi:hypothetical protein
VCARVCVCYRGSSDAPLQSNVPLEKADNGRAKFIKPKVKSAESHGAEARAKRNACAFGESSMISFPRSTPRHRVREGGREKLFERLHCVVLRFQPRQRRRRSSLTRGVVSLPLVSLSLASYYGDELGSGHCYSLSFALFLNIARWLRAVRPAKIYRPNADGFGRLHLRKELLCPLPLSHSLSFSRSLAPAIVHPAIF